jgi:hypothetical protein
MGTVIYVFEISCLVLGAFGLISAVFTEESDGTRLTARAVRAVGFLLLAGLLKNFFV